MTGYLLDTNVCIAFATGRSATLLLRMEAASGQMAMSAITHAELQVGARGSSDPDGDRHRLALLTRHVPVLAFDEAAGVAYGRIAREGGFRRGSFDLLIGAHAAMLGRTLVTANLRGFADIPGLEVEDWTA